jgi:protoheme ferro-lyase
MTHLEDLENQIYELQEELKLREFIECPCCNSEMQWINKREYGCMNENCTSIARVI